MIDLVPLGDRAWLARFASIAEAQQWAEAARALAPKLGASDVVLAYDSVAVYLDPVRADPEAFATAARQINPVAAPESSRAIVSVPVLYNGPDLPEIARHVGLSVEEVIALHSSATYTIQAIGFRPGFPYAGPLPAALSGLARRAVPRPRVERGSVAIAGTQTCVYPEASPGGWHVLGITPLRIANWRDAHFPLRAGDLLTFEPIDGVQFRALLYESLQVPSRAAEEEHIAARLSMRHSVKPGSCR